MKKLHLLAAALFAVFAFGTIAASSAFAAAEWLVNGAVVGSTEERAVETTGTFNLIVLAGEFLEPEAVVLCEGALDGYILSGGKDLVSEVLNAAKEATSEAKPLICEGVTGCEKMADVKFVAQNLPWATTLELMEPKSSENIYLDLFFQETGSAGKPAYLMICLVVGIERTTLCEGETSAVVHSLANGNVLAAFKAGELVSEKLEGACFEGATEHKEATVQEGEMETKVVGGGKLEVSTTSSEEKPAKAEWLVNGAAISVGTEPAVEATGELEFIYLAGGFLEPEAIVRCKGIFAGTVLTEGKGLVSAVLNEAKEETTETKPLICEGVKTCEKVADVEVLPQNLPWATILELMEPKLGEELFLDLFFQEAGSTGKPAYLATCLVFGAQRTTLCEGETSADVKNLTGGTVEDVFTPSELVAEKLELPCFEGSTEYKEVAVYEGKLVTILVKAGDKLEASG